MEEMSRPTPVLTKNTGIKNPARNATMIVASPKCSDTTEKARANVMASPARSARNKLTFSHSVGNVAGHRRLENDPAVMREQAGNCIKGSPPQTAFERSHLALVQSEGQFRAA